MKTTDFLNLEAKKINRWKRKARLAKLRKIFDRDGQKCYWCPERLTLDSATVDHVIPISQGGLNVLWNTVASCTQCNSMKGDQVPSNGPSPIAKFLARYKNFKQVPVDLFATAKTLPSILKKRKHA